MDIQRISENIVREIEKSLANGADSVDGTSADDKMGKGGASNLSNKEDFSSFSSFFGSGCRKLIESLMKKTADSNSSNGIFFYKCQLIFFLYIQAKCIVCSKFVSCTIRLFF